MANSFEIIRYKQQLMSLFINNERIVELIDSKEVQDEDDIESLIRTHIFDYIRIPSSPDEAKTYIAMEIDIPKIYTSESYLFKKLIITIHIITHEELMPTIYDGTRIDLISAEIDKMLNGYEGIGKKPLDLINNISGSISVKHRERIMQFVAEDMNKSLCLKK